MDVSQGSNGTPPFLTKTYDMVDDPSTNSVVSWSLSGKSFVVWNPLDFARDLLPKYFKHNNFSSFIRQLNTYGFRKIDPEQWEFANDEFIRGQRHLLKNIHRRKPIHSHSQQHHQAQGNSSGVLSEAERQELEEVIERLKHEKNMLLSEVQRNDQQKHGIDLQMQSLEERLHHMEHRQLQMRDFLMRIVQRPGFVSNLLHQSENHNKKRRLPKPDSFGNDTEDDEHVAFQAVMREKSDIVSVRVLNTDPFEKMESSINSWENFFRGVGHASGEEVYGGSTQWQPSTVVLTEVLTSYRDPDSNLQPESPKIRPSSPHSRDIRSSPDLTESTSFVESPAISPICLPADNQLKDSWIDVNSRPAPIEVQSSKERTNIGSAAPTGENDVFWEQFLTETPGLSDTREVQLESRDADSKKCGSKQAEFGNFWWNKKSVDHLTEQMGQLSPAERT